MRLWTANAAKIASDLGCTKNILYCNISYIIWAGHSAEHPDYEKNVINTNRNDRSLCILRHFFCLQLHYSAFLWARLFCPSVFLVMHLLSLWLRMMACYAVYQFVHSQELAHSHSELINLPAMSNKSFAISELLHKHTNNTLWPVIIRINKIFYSLFFLFCFCLTRFLVNANWIYFTANTLYLSGLVNRWCLLTLFYIKLFRIASLLREKLI